MPDTIFCSQCGTPLDSQARVCSKCGATVASAPATSAASAGAQAATAVAPAPVPPPPQYGAAPPAPQYGSITPAPPQYGVAPQPSPAAPYAAGVSPYAGFWIRVGAYLIDGLVVLIPAFLLALIPILGIILDIVGVWLYFALQESSERQATIGKRAVGIYVTDLQGRRIAFGQATGRYFSKILSGLILDIGYIMVAFTEKKQGLHDMIASTLVMRR